MHPACPNKKQNHLQNSLLRRTQFWVRKSFSKPASLKRASLVALPVAISQKGSLKPKRCASATLIQKTSKNEPKHGPKNGTAWRSHFWDRMHSLVKECSTTQAHSPIRTPRYSATWYVLIQLTRYRNDGGVRKPSILHLSTSFPKQILTPSRFKLILLINNGSTEKNIIHVLSGDRLAVPKMRPQNRKINSKGRPVQQTKNDNCV